MRYVRFCASIATVAFLASAFAPAYARDEIGPGAIVSTVHDLDGKPVEGALVIADGPTTREAFTGSAGIVTLLGLPLGNYVVRVIRSGYAPASANVNVGRRAGEGIRVVRMSIAPASFANVGGAVARSVPAGLDGGNAPYLAAALTTALAADVVPAYLSRGVAPTLQGTAAGETRVELDGIPIAGGPGGVAALQVRSPLQLDHVELVGGPALPSTSLESAIGGVINYRTAPISTTLDTGLTFGYDTALGSFARARFSNTYGKLGILADLLSGQGTSRGEVVKGRLALSPSTTLLASAYASQATLARGSSSTTNDAPAYALDLRTMLGSGTLQGRLFSSESDSTESSNAAVVNTEDWRLSGLQLGYDLPLGESLFRAGFERDTAKAIVDGNTIADQTISTLRLGAELQLSRTSRLEIADAIGDGSDLSRRNDPQLALVLRASPEVTLRFAAGSAYATSLDVLAAAAAAGAPPETSFGYRASADAALPAGGHVHAALFTLRRFDAFAALAEARSTGLELGYERPALPGGLGVVAAVDLTRTYEFGTQQSALRFDGLPVLAGSQLIDDPFSKARLALAYRTNDMAFDFGSTLLGSNNAFASHAVLLGDVSMRLSLASVADVRLGVENLFGQTVADPVLAPLYPRHEVTIAVGRFSGD